MRGGAELGESESSSDAIDFQTHTSSYDRRRRDYGVLFAMAGLCFTFLLQFGGGIWWGATLSSDLRHVTEALARMETERYTKSDATRDIQRLDQRDGAFTDQIVELRARMTRAEERIANIAESLGRGK